MKDRRDTISHDRRNHAVLLDRSRRDLIGWVHPNAVEPYSSLYLDAMRLEEVFKHPPSWRKEKPSGAEWLVEWLDNNLIISSSRRGWRADALERVLRGDVDDDDGMATRLGSARGGLKGRANGGKDGGGE